MNSRTNPLKLAMICAVLLLGNGAMQWIVDSDLGVGWVHNVLRNWDQMGLVTLKGRLVENPGGYDALEHPDVYPGHRPTSIYPVYVAGKVFGWTGLHALPFHVLLTLTVLISMWSLLGGTDRALFAGAVAVFCPGFVLWPTVLDPNALSMLFGLPYAVLLWRILRRDALRKVDIVNVLALTVVFTILNWTTALVHAQIFLTFLALRVLPLKRMVFYAMAGAVAAVVVVMIGVGAKLAEGAATKLTFAQMLGGYMWGEGGYGNGSTTPTLLLRVAFINALALFPLWLLWLANWIPCLRRNACVGISALGPLVLAALETLAMRNYFCHHPWMAAPLLLVAAIFSLWVMWNPAKAAADAPAVPRKPEWNLSWSLVAAAVFMFGAAVLIVDRAHTSRLLSLAAMLRANTARSDMIMVSSAVDADTARYADRLPEEMDRRVIIVDGAPDPKTAPAGSYLLSATEIKEGWRLVGQNRPDSIRSLPLVEGLLNWFTKNVSKRKPGDRMELADTYYLYAPVK